MIKFKTHLQYSWWKYGLIFIAAIVLWTMVFSSLAEPKDNEEVVIVYYGGNYDSESMNSELKDRFLNGSDLPLKSISFGTVASENSTGLTELIDANVYSSDIMIFSDSILKEALNEEFILYYCAPISETAISDHFQNDDARIEFYYVNGKPYGIIFDPLGEKNNFLKHYSTEERCIAFFCANASEDLLSLGDMEKSIDDEALSVMKYLLEVN